MRLFPVIARQAEHLTVFQRTAQANYAEIWKKCKSNGNGRV